MYYINPWVFYIIGLISNIQTFYVFFVALGGFCWLLSFMLGSTFIEDFTKTAEEEERFKSVFFGNG